MTEEEFLAEVERRTGSHRDIMLTDIKQARAGDTWAQRNVIAWLEAIIGGEFDLPHG